MHSEKWYQYTLIGAGVLTSALLGVYFTRELFPEYKIYQEDYIALEEFRSSYTHEAPPDFKIGVKQILLEREDKGNPTIDRCISCHVALQFPHFSPTKVARDSNGNVLVDAQGHPKLIPNEEYVWGKLDSEIATLEEHGAHAAAAKLAALKVAHVGEHTYDVTKVLRMHPLIGRETRPFEFHPIEEYGCTSCHNGNGRGLTTEKAHGPVFDGDYEKEFTGYEPQFTEQDRNNDPRFATVFNGKPGHNLLFQTTPLYVDALIQAKCMQCHQSTKGLETLGADSTVLNLAAAIDQHISDVTSSPEKAANDQQNMAAIASDIDLLTYNYQRGEQLFISQACYACHRIAGLTRGGIGPELTHSGQSYPWFVKQSIVWPQADLKTSTMPNFRLDHEELQDLVTFLLGQNGRNKATSEMAYKTAIQSWEAGQKRPWEKPISPLQIQDLRYGMTVFATEGCAACHRLEGFDSNVGFGIEKNRDKPPTFDALYSEKNWFKELFPEGISGRQLVDVLETHAREIDSRIVDGVRDNGIIEEIDKNHPSMIEALYTPFKFAMRAKDHFYKEAIANSHDSKVKADLEVQHADWKARTHRVLAMFIQEYGLGRLIGPKPNWSGVYRSDEWLMEHFRNPSSHVPRSIMPVMPFDDTKFYALIHMLDVLGIRNRDAVRAIWDHRGFNPELAYQIYCAQCHGEQFRGNGPIAEWIYPIPKNLGNADFMRNLERPQAAYTIAHGIKGTPMPPWGEVATDKAINDGIPVLTAQEIDKLVDWLFNQLPGSAVFRGAVPKWQYSPNDVFEELQKEGSLPQLIKPKADKSDPLAALRHRLPPLWASLQPQLLPATESSAAAAEKQESPPHKDDSPLFNYVEGPPGENYYIKKEFYTPENIAEGRRFFELNCAACHGKEGDGTGLRAGTMVEAKPRMLTNLDWLKTRDDMDLLRSIKYGVAGTAMIPWGDQTSSMQRLQLVMFIHTLSEQRLERDKLAEAIYRAFDRLDALIEQARAAGYGALASSKKQLAVVKQQLKDADRSASSNPTAQRSALELYQQELKLRGLLQMEAAADGKLLAIKAALKKEKELYQAIGSILIQQEQVDSLAALIALLQGLNDRYALKDGVLTLVNQDNRQQQAEKQIAAISSNFDLAIADVQQKKSLLENQPASTGRSQQLSDINGKITTMQEAKMRTAQLFTQAQELASQGATLLQQQNKQGE